MPPIRSATWAAVGTRPSSVSSCSPARVTFIEELLEVARGAHGPALVAEVALELAQDRRRRKGRERDAAIGIEAVDRLQQPERRDLDEILGLRVVMPVALGEVPGERQELGRQRVACRDITMVAIALEQTADLVAAVS